MNLTFPRRSTCILLLAIAAHLGTACLSGGTGGLSGGTGGTIYKNDCTGEDKSTGCDDCNPCTNDANCTPCSSLPPEEQSDATCVPDDQLKPFCVGHLGECAHFLITDTAGAQDTCFPLADLFSRESTGHCCAGVCAHNEDACSDDAGVGTGGTGGMLR